MNKHLEFFSGLKGDLKDAPKDIKVAYNQLIKYFSYISDSRFGSMIDQELVNELEIARVNMNKKYPILSGTEPLLPFPKNYKVFKDSVSTNIKGEYKQCYSNALNLTKKDSDYKLIGGFTISRDILIRHLIEMENSDYQRGIYMMCIYQHAFNLKNGKVIDTTLDHNDFIYLGKELDPNDFDYGMPEGKHEVRCLGDYLTGNIK